MRTRKLKKTVTFTLKTISNLLIILLLSSCATGRKFSYGTKVVVDGEEFYNGCVGEVTDKAKYWWGSSLYYVDLLACPNVQNPPPFDLVISEDKLKRYDRK